MKIQSNTEWTLLLRMVDTGSMINSERKEVKADKTVQKRKHGQKKGREEREAKTEDKNE